VLTAYDPREYPDENPLTEAVYTFNSSFLQIFENFDQLVEKLDGLLQSHDQTSIPNIINVINEIKRIQSSVGIKAWQAARVQRNFMVHEYPRNGELWRHAWVPLKRAIEPVGLAAQHLYATIPQIKQQRDNLKKVCRRTLLL